MTEVVIDGKRYQEMPEDATYSIVVLDRGFVVYGIVTYDNQYLIIDSCQCIRRWGTTRGLGELAANGPREKTVLDPQPRTRVHELQVVQIIDCEGGPWSQ